MAQIAVKITGIARGIQGATFTWSQQIKPLVDFGGGNLQTSFLSDPGTFLYSLVVFGPPGDAWTLLVTDGTTVHNHAGHMSPAGFDTTGDTAFTVVNPVVNP